MPDESAEQRSVLLERPRGDVALVRFNRPDRLNALTLETVDLFTSTMVGLRGERDLRAVVVTGAGRAFCAGLDIGGFMNRDRADRTSVDRFDSQERFAAMVRAVRDMPQPVIAAVNGPVAGAGMGVALAADIRLAADTARFVIGAIKIGLSAGECGISWHLPRLVGMSRAMEIMLTGRPVDAVEAERIGLVSRVLPGPELLAAGLDMAAAIASNSPFGIRMTKRVAWTNLGLSFDDGLELENRTQILTVMTDDSKDAMRAFTEKRAPEFRYR
jgi:enoyl-CoA hydratase